MTSGGCEYLAALPGGERTGLAERLAVETTAEAVAKIIGLHASRRGYWLLKGQHSGTMAQAELVDKAWRRLMDGLAG
jgi:hypothetical protein